MDVPDHLRWKAYNTIIQKKASTKAQLFLIGAVAKTFTHWWIFKTKDSEFSVLILLVLIGGGIQWSYREREGVIVLLTWCSNEETSPCYYWSQRPCIVNEH